MSVLLITGPPASGKNTVGEMVASQRKRCAAVSVDLLRQMLVHGQKNPWQGEEGVVQQDLAVKNAAALARNFDVAGFDCVISDVVTEATHDLYKHELGKISLHTILLLPSEDEITARMLSRPDYLSRGGVTPAYDQQSKFGSYDDRLDNTAMAPGDATEWILERWGMSTK